MWHGGLIDNGPGDIFTIYQGPEEYLLAWGELWETMSYVGLIEQGTVCLLAGREGSLGFSQHLLAGWVYWGPGTSYCVGFHMAKACWA